MSWRSPWPRSLSGQIALLIAIALFLAQAVNFALLYQGHAQLAQQTIVGPAVTHYIDAAERLNHGLSLDGAQPGRIELTPTSPVRPAAPHSPPIENAVRIGLRDAGMGEVRVETEIRTVPPEDRWVERFGRTRAAP